MKSADQRAIWLATICGFVLLAQHLAGRAVRDALFLTAYPVTKLPGMQFVSALTSVAVAIAVGKWFSKVGPRRGSAWLFSLSAGLWMLDWWLVVTYPKVGGAAVFLHLAVLGGVLISGLWSLVNERFDPFTAKAASSKLTLGMNVGALVGGIVVERVAAMADIAYMLPTMAAAHAICAVLILGLKVPQEEGDPAASDPGAAPDGEKASATMSSGLQQLAESSYLRSLAVFVLLVTVSTQMFDYALKAAASEAFERNALGRFFAVFYTGASLLTLVLQATVTTRLLDRIGVAGSALISPLIVAGLGALALLFPGLWLFAIVVGVRSVIGNSIYRSAYEAFYTPLKRATKRATKSIIDVGFDQLGTGLGAAVIALLVLAGPASTSLIVGVGVITSLTAVFVARILGRGYVEALEEAMEVHGALPSRVDATPSMAAIQAIGGEFGTWQGPGLDLPDEALKSGESSVPNGSRGAKSSRKDVSVRNDANTPEGEERPLPPATTSSGGLGAEMAPSPEPQYLNVATGRARRRRGRRVGLATQRPPEKSPAGFMRAPTPQGAAVIIPLLSRDDRLMEVQAALRKHAPRFTGQMVDALCDDSQPFAVRRRLPAIIAHGHPVVAVSGLWVALSDRRFEVRYRSGRAMVRLASRSPELFDALDGPRVEQLVHKELEVPRRMWTSRHLLDGEGDDGDGDTWLGALAQHRVDRSLEHVFNLLALALQREPLRTAFRALHTNNKELRGTALEYLHTVLPGPMRERLWDLIAAPIASVDEALTEEAAQKRLMLSMASIDAALEAQESAENQTSFTPNDEEPDENA